MSLGFCSLRDSTYSNGQGGKALGKYGSEKFDIAFHAKWTAKESPLHCAIVNTIKSYLLFTLHTCSNALRGSWGRKSLQYVLYYYATISMLLRLHNCDADYNLTSLGYSYVTNFVESSIHLIKRLLDILPCFTKLNFGHCHF